MKSSNGTYWVQRSISNVLVFTALACSGFPQRAWSQGQPDTGVQNMARPQASHHPISSQLDADPRLQQRLALDYPSINLLSLIDVLKRTSGVELTASPIVEHCIVSCRYKSVRLVDLMTNVAATRFFHWVKTDHGGWNLSVPTVNLDWLKPHSQQELDQQQRGLRFQQMFDSLSADQKQALSGDGNRNTMSGGMAFNSLPSDMQDVVNDMLTSQIQAIQATGSLLGTMENATVRYLQVESQPEYSRNEIQIITSATVGNTHFRSSNGIDFVIFSNPDENNTIVPAGFENSSRGKSEAFAKRSALNNDPRLARKISLRLEFATFAQALRAVAQLSELDYVLIFDDPAPVVLKSFAITNMPVSEVLSYLEKLYQFEVATQRYQYVWTQTKGGLFVFHTMGVPNRPKILEPSSSVHGQTGPSTPGTSR